MIISRYGFGGLAVVLMNLNFSSFFLKMSEKLINRGYDAMWSLSIDVFSPPMERQNAVPMSGYD
jgi:hypothetical protein